MPSSIPTLSNSRTQPKPAKGGASRGSQHARSISHPFPSLFGGKKKSHNNLRNDSALDSALDSTDDDAVDTSVRGNPLVSPLKRKNTGKKMDDVDVETGYCMTCGSKVRWPKHLNVFRCTACLTVNDLEPVDNEQLRHVGSLSVGKAKAIIDRCITSYLEARIKDSLEPDVPNYLAPLLSAGSPNPAGRGGGVPSGTPARPTRKPPPPPVQTQRMPTEISWEDPKTPPIPSPLPPSDAPREPHRYIFRPLEEHIIAAFSDLECINTSFNTSRPPFGGRARSEGSAHTPAPDKQEEQPVVSDDLLSGLDAKVLLLGDFAENGSWWTGRVERTRSDRAPMKRDQPTNSPKTIVSHKSPCINWKELHHWYDTVLGAGLLWKDMFQAMRLGTSDQFGDVSSQIHVMEEEIYESRIHAQRTLLKVTETLLKRPGRPLKEADDIRFLLILLSNPLLYPSHAASPPSPKFKRRLSEAPNSTPSRERSALAGPPTGPASSQRSPHSRRESGQHSGIVKRILGLLSNLPIDCHRYLITWFSRLSEDHFRRIMDLVASFVNYRLTREHGRRRSNSRDPMAGLIPEFNSSGANTSAQLHAALGLSTPSKKADDGRPQAVAYSDDWQLRAAAKVMALLFAANNMYHGRKLECVNLPPSVAGPPSAGLAAQRRARSHGQLLPTSDFYNALLDYHDLIADFEVWETRRGHFSFCQYPFFLSIGAKIRIMEHDARRQMENKAREAFFDSILSNKAIEQYFTLRVRRDCLVDDSLKRIAGSVGAGQEEIKKGLRVSFIGEEGIDAGGLRKEWFLLLVRDLFDPNHGLFVYDEDSHFCYFNPHSFEPSDQYFLVGAVLGLAIYNSTILDVALPPFAFKKLLAAAPTQSPSATSSTRPPLTYTLEDLAEFRPALAHGLRQLLEYDGDVESTFCRDFVAEVDRYDSIAQFPLCPGGETRPVTNSNRQEFVDLYVRYLLDIAVARQFEPFKRGFFTVCGGNALSLFRPEEIELLVRGSDEPLDIPCLRAVAAYDNWKGADGKLIPSPSDNVDVVRWFWEFFEEASPRDQRKILSFVTGSDRIPAVGATSLVIRLGCAGEDSERFPIARTCFNLLLLYRYASRDKFRQKLWRAVTESEGFGLK